jgi:CRP/FNR family transcriptional regulator, cyclic AMP receptor protein
VLEALSKRLRATDNMVEDLIFLDVYGRVAKKLLELADAHGVQTEDGIIIDVRLTQQELASMVGASRESVNKVLGYFTDKKFISTDKHRITIHRVNDLKRRIY